MPATNGWVIQEYPKFFQSAMIIRCDDDPADQEANARRQLQGQTERRRRLRRGRTEDCDEERGCGGEDRVNPTSSLDVECFGGLGCTLGPEAIKVLYDRGFGSNITSAVVEYPCISLAEVYSLGNLYIKSMYSVFKAEWAYTSEEYSFGVFAELVVGFIYGAALTNCRSLAGCTVAPQHR